MSLARRAVSEHLKAQIAVGQPPPHPSYDQRLCEAVEAAIYGAGALQELLDSRDVENIDINGCDEVWVTYADDRGKVRGQPVAATDEELVDIVRTLGAYAGLNARPFTPANPELDLRLPDGSRLSAVMLASERPAVSIRRHRFSQMFLDEVPAHAAASRDGQRPATLLELGTIDEQLASFLQRRRPGPGEHHRGRRDGCRKDHTAARSDQLRAAARAARHGGAGPGARAAAPSGTAP